MTLRLVSLDLSLTATGAAWTHDWRGTPALGVRTITSRHTGHQRLADILTEIATVCRSRPALVAIEHLPMVGNTGKTALLLAELHGLVKQMLWGNNIPYVFVQNAHIKQFATGWGATHKDRATGEKVAVDKDAVLLAVERTYGDLVTVRNNNEADSLALLALTALRYGQQLAPVTVRQAAVTSKVDWPADIIVQPTH
jgi:Holliday junction resolvasome RuvABC endonuclease subunit